MGWFNCPDQGHKDVVTLCGSTRFKKEFEEIQKELTLRGKIVISVGCFGHLGELPVGHCQDGNEIKANLDLLHLKKIDLASEIYVINPTGYIGTSTKREIEYAHYLRRKITFYANEKEGATLKPEDFEPVKWANIATGEIYW